MTANQQRKKMTGNQSATTRKKDAKGWTVFSAKKRKKTRYSPLIFLQPYS